MDLRILAVVGLLVAPAVLAAQSERFDVASVKPQTRLLGGGSITGTRLYMPGNTLRRVIEFAYDLPPVRIVGGPAWMASDLWEIDARSPVPATADEMRVMVKALLTERFELMTRVESRDLPVYDLHLARSDGTLGPNLTPPAECTPIGARSRESLHEAGEIPCGPMETIALGVGGTTSFGLRGVTISAFARYLERFVGRVVRDRTGISDEFDIRLRYADGRTPLAPPRALHLAFPPSLPEALEEQLGLKVEATTAPVDVLVIESVARPMPN